MSDVVSLRRATSADLSSIEELWNEAREWLARAGSDQWQYPLKRHSMLDSIEQGESWIAEDSSGAIAGTITIDDDADPEFWGPSDHPERAVYVHRMIVSRSHRRLRVGTQLLAWADDVAREMGRSLVRLDAWRTNQALHSYYMTQGFRLVRVVTLPHRRSGALFERAVT